MEDNTTEKNINDQLQTAYNTGYVKGKQDSWTELFKDENFINLVNNTMKQYNDNKIEHLIHENKTNVKMYWQDIILVLIILMAICSLSFIKLLDACTIGTLIGAVIGYALGRFNNQC
jgi:hypothetical protein